MSPANAARQLSVLFAAVLVCAGLGPAAAQVADESEAASAANSGQASDGRPSDGLLGGVLAGGGAAAGGDAAPVIVQSVTLDRPAVITTARLRAGAETIPLFGIEGFSGAPAQALQAFLDGVAGPLSCQPQEAAGGTAGYVCVLPDGNDLAQVALLNGQARIAQDAPDEYLAQQASAQALQRGIWARQEGAEQVAHPVVQDTATLAANGQTYTLWGIVGLGAPFGGRFQATIRAAGDSLTCAPQAPLGRYTCLLPDGTDLAKLALVNGVALVAPDAPPAYRLQQADAMNQRRGYWRDVPPDAAEPPPDQAVLAGTGTPDVLSGDNGSAMATAAPAGETPMIQGEAPMIEGEAPVIEGEPMFVVLGAAGAGWGYYDHWRRWHMVPDRDWHGFGPSSGHWRPGSPAAMAMRRTPPPRGAVVREAPAERVETGGQTVFRAARPVPMPRTMGVHMAAPPPRAPLAHVSMAPLVRPAGMWRR